MAVSDRFRGISHSLSKQKYRSFQLDLRRALYNALFKTPTPMGKFLILPSKYCIMYSAIDMKHDFGNRYDILHHPVHKLDTRFRKVGI